MRRYRLSTIPALARVPSRVVARPMLLVPVKDAVALIRLSAMGGGLYSGDRCAASFRRGDRTVLDRSRRSTAAGGFGLPPELRPARRGTGESAVAGQSN
jgi:hypothetical protein